MVIALNIKYIPTLYSSSVLVLDASLIVEVSNTNCNIAIVFVLRLSAIINCHIVVELAHTLIDSRVEIGCRGTE